MKLSQKISLMNITISLFLIVVLIVGDYIINYNSLIKKEKLILSNYADEIASDLSRIIKEKVKTSRSVAHNPFIISTVIQNNQFYENNYKDNIENEILQKNEKWMATDNSDDEFILQYTNNSLAKYLGEQQKLLTGEYGEIFVTNKYGAVVAATTKLTTFKHNQKYWWKGAYNDSKGTIFIDDRGYDESAKQVVLGIVVPIIQNDEIIGIVKFNVNIKNTIQDIVTSNRKRFAGDIKIIRTNGLILWDGVHEPLTTSLENFQPENYKKNQKGAFLKNTDKDKLVGFSQVNFTSNTTDIKFGGNNQSIDHKFGNKNEQWYVKVSNPISIYKQQIFEEIEFFALGYLILVLVIIGVSYFINSKITSSLKTISQAAQQISNGDIRSIPEYPENDEIGILTKAINLMVQTLNYKNSQLETIIDNIPGLIFYKDDKNNFLQVNKYLADSHNKPKEWFTNRNVSTIYPVEAAKAYLEDDLTVINSKKPLLNREEKWEIDGVVNWVRTSKIPILDPLTNERSILGISFNFTKEKEMMENLKNEMLFSKKITETTPTGVYIHDFIKNRTIYTNHQYQEIFGYNIDDINQLIDTDSSSLFHPNDIKKVMDHLEKLKTSKKNIQIEYRFKHKEGHWIWIYVINSPFKVDDQGNVISFIGSFLDISKSKKLEAELKESELFYKKMFNNNTIMLLIDPEDGQIIDANKSACNYYGYNCDKMKNMKMPEINISTKTHIKSEMQKAKKENKIYFDYKHKLANGEIRDVEIYTGPIEIKQKTYLLSLIHDVTDKKIIESKVKAYTKEVEDINKKLEDYSYTISHDLKEPIRSITTFSKFILEDNDSQFDKQTQDYFNRIINASSKMKLMIDDLLILSRIGKKDIDFNKVSILTITNDVIHILNEQIESKHAAISVGEMPEIFCQPIWIKVIFQNLISNSIKYGGDNVTIEINYKDIGNYHEFSIKDNGLGIAADQHQKIFGLFRKGHQDKNIEGSGAGLSIVESVVKQHNGNVWIHWSEPDKGTEIKFTIFKNLG